MKKSYLIQVLLFFIICGFPITTFAQISVEVSQNYSAIEYASEKMLVAQEGTEVFELYSTPSNDKYKAAIIVQGGSLQLVVIDRRDAIKKNPNPNFLMNRKISGKVNIDFPELPSKEGIGIIILNNTNKSVDLKVTVFRLGIRSTQVVGEMKKIIELPIKSLDAFYKLPKFKILITPCGYVNAYSSPDIIICSELIADLEQKNLNDALYPILLHELAHSILYLWGLPGYDNEDFADEFATVFLAGVEPKLVDAFISYLSSNDSVSEAIVQLVNGDRHTISIQRARNMKKILENPDPLLKRWAKFLAPYKRN